MRDRGPRQCPGTESLLKPLLPDKNPAGIDGDPGQGSASQSVACISRSAQQGDLVIRYNPHRYRLQQFTHSTLGGERLHEVTLPQPLKEFRRNAAGEVDATAGHLLQGEVTGLRTVAAHKNIQRLHAGLVPAVHRSR